MSKCTVTTSSNAEIVVDAEGITVGERIGTLSLLDAIGNVTATWAPGDWVSAVMAPVSP